jgi:hypothetical protein
MDTAKNPLPLHKLVEAQPVELTVVSVRDLPDWGISEDHMVVLAESEADHSFYAGTITVSGDKPAKGEKWTFTRDDAGFTAATKSSEG